MYDATGERTGKYGENGETLYFNSWLTATEEGNRYRYSKHIFVGSERVVTRLKSSVNANWESEDVSTYYYHPDHLGSTSVVTDPKGNAYERIEYTPFGEMWLEHKYYSENTDYIPYRFTSKEWDEETGLYYYGARYYEPRISRWMSADPAGFGLINPMGNDGKPKEDYSIIESLNYYSYVANNPINYVDPNGEFFLIDDFIFALVAKIFGYNDHTRLFKLTWALFRSSWKNPVSHFKTLVDFVKKVEKDRMKDGRFKLNETIDVSGDGLGINFDDDHRVTIGGNKDEFRFGISIKI